jgi:hypothetical protein
MKFFWRKPSAPQWPNVVTDYKTGVEVPVIADALCSVISAEVMDFPPPRGFLHETECQPPCPIHGKINKYA